MGLDMYLTKKVYVKNWKHTPKENISKINATIGNEKINTDKAVNIEIEVAYWRKANSIHGWFVREIQEGVDNCAQYRVDIHKIQELVKICLQLKNLYKEDRKLFLEYAEKVLPTESGFFFGDTEFDEYYIADLTETIIQLGDLNPKHEYYYESSW